VTRQLAEVAAAMQGKPRRWNDPSDVPTTSPHLLANSSVCSFRWLATALTHGQSLNALSGFGRSETTLFSEGSSQTSADFDVGVVGRVASSLLI
jgi:hypothetical protein